MFTVVVYGLIAIAVAAALVALLVLVLPEDQMNRPAADVVPVGLPRDREITAEDLTRIRIPVAVRGYRMVDTDAALDRLTAEIARRDEEIAQLRRSVQTDADGPAAHSVARADGQHRYVGSSATAAIPSTAASTFEPPQFHDRAQDDRSRDDHGPAPDDPEVAAEEAEEEAEAEAEAHPT